MRRYRKILNIRLISAIVLLLVISSSSIFRSCYFEENYQTIHSDKSILVLFTRYDDVVPKIKSYLDNAKKSIYIAVFEIGNRELIQGLMDAKNRGIDVKIITDKDNLDYPELQKVLNSNIEVVFQEDNSYMHHKFAIIDEEIVITGSMNWTDNDIYKNDNNILIIRSKALAGNYLKEFNQMFYEKKFSRAKEKIGNNIIMLDDIRIENYFSPEEKPSRRIIEIIDQSQKTIDFMAFSFTHDKIASAMIRAHSRGVKVSGIFETRQVSKFSEYEKLKEKGMNVILDKNPKNMHNKVIIVDSSIVITGSYNFSSNADNENDENVIIIFSKEVALKYLNYFNRLLN
ncbi:MAG: phospholipase D-like domain-containing protein [candidate division WOR-3 bacterium]|nr:phospholipase D-like domain-containing protein [candidate division WOR-3 bacterium]MCX7947869.1 phospholipase D-like domain-containing protein [candidate division WOR-3 bacterium]MDW8150691.1 phospholipase D-like domain-containing protein [candidate division WOR-3 bacterium]